MAIYLNNQALGEFCKREMFEDDINNDKSKYFDKFRYREVIDDQGKLVSVLDNFITQAKGDPETKLSFSIRGKIDPEDKQKLSEVDYDLEILGKLMPDILGQYKKCHKVEDIEVGFKCMIDIKGVGELELNDIERVAKIKDGKFVEFIQISSGKKIENIDEVVEKANSSKLVDRAGKFIDIMERLKIEHNFIEVDDGLENLRKLLGAMEWIDGARGSKASHDRAEDCGPIMRPCNNGECAPLKGVGGSKQSDR
jgi:hypothetical protein